MIANIFTLADKIKVCEKLAGSFPFAGVVAGSTTISLVSEFDRFMQATAEIMADHFAICAEAWPVSDEIAKRLSDRYDAHIEEVNYYLERFDTDGWGRLVDQAGTPLIDWAYGNLSSVIDEMKHQPELLAN